MKKKLISWVGNRLKSRAESTNEIVRVAQSHFANEFPNPRREDCPRPGEFAELMHNQQFPDQDLRRHLLTCSECLQDYQSTLIAQREAVEVSSATVPRLKPALVSTRTVAIAFATLLVVISAAAIMVWVRWQSGVILDRTASDGNDPLKPPANQISPSKPTPSSSSTIAKSGVENLRKQPGAKRSPELIAANKVQINLEESSRQRGTNKTDSRLTILYAGINEITIRLPSGSPTGPYQVTLADPFGDPVVSAVARSHDGSVLHAELKLISVRPGSYLICVTRNTEVPDCVPAVIRGP